MIDINMKDKKTIILILAVLTVVVVFFAALLKKPTVQPTDQSVSQESQNKVVKPSYLLGAVTKVDGEKIYYKFETQEKVAIVSSKTEIVRQTKTKTVTVNVPAKLSEIKAGSLVVFYPKPDLTAAEYQPQKIQIVK